ncbi:MAG TPA: sugar transferase [Anaeromyxobacteraceae bacterium]|nr:sugar transferase [Anaeromyxobacteraceae bacterium]
MARAVTGPGFRAPPSARDLLDVSVPVRAAVAAMALVISWHLILASRGVYSSRRLLRFRNEARDLFFATGSATIALTLVSWLVRGNLPRPDLLAAFFGVGTAALITSRAVARGIAYELRLRGRDLRQVVIVGTNARAREYAAHLRARPEMGYVVAGFVDEPAALPAVAGVGGLLSNFDSFPDFLRQHVVDEVVLFVPVKSFYERISRIVALCQEHGITARVRADLFDLKLGDLRVEEIPGLRQPLATVRTGRMRGPLMAVKRFIDVAGALSLLVITSPCLLGAALVIRLASPGPIFFVQERLGLNKRRFRLLKFRTMVPGAEKLQSDLAARNEVRGPVFKIRDDPRITPIGRFLRRTSIDELPQLLNVLKGDMSLVGPRPLPIRDYEGFYEDAHRRRFSVRPGLTCLWQVSGRNQVPFDRWMMLDMQYIDTWSLWMDITILVRTVPAVIRATGS